MLDALVAISVAALVLAGVSIMLGPEPPRRLLTALRKRRRGRVRTRRRPVRPEVANEPPLHPTTERAVQTAIWIISLLEAQGPQGSAGELKKAVKRVKADEATGLYALLQAGRVLRELSLERPQADHELQQSVVRMLRVVRDRAEQLELLPFS